MTYEPDNLGPHRGDAQCVINDIRQGLQDYADGLGEPLPKVFDDIRALLSQPDDAH
jgi:hypothetical protein